MDTKKCSKCGEVKGVEEFSVDRSRKDGLRRECKACKAAAARSYRAAHPEQGRERERAWRAAHPEQVREYGRTYRAAHPEQYHLRSVKRRAAHLGVPFTLTVETLPPMPKACPALGIQLQRGGGTPRALSPSIDRLIPVLGYVPGNVAWLSNRANAIKSNYTPEGLEQRAAADPTNEELRRVAEWTRERLNLLEA